ncbi:MAG: hypothetical protein H6709_05375 [Kofleriaceae bacterium]|nr:hypothetical protein [Kofleriaceae bacterium]
MLGPQRRSRDRQGRHADGHRARQVDGIPAADALFAGGQVGCVLGGGETWCWGKNTHGQIGVGNTQPVNMPVRVDGLAGATQLAIGGEHVCG